MRRLDSRVMTRRDGFALWTALPRRLYLDTSTLQTIHDFGGSIFDGEPFETVGRARARL